MARVVPRSPELNAGWPQQVCTGASTTQPASSSSLTAAKPMEGRIRSTRQVTNSPTRLPRSGITCSAPHLHGPTVAERNCGFNQTLVLPTHAGQEGVDAVAGARHVGREPVVADFALKLPVARHLVDDGCRDKEALVLARTAARRLVVVEAHATLERADQPQPEGLVDLQRYIAAQHARDVRHNAFVGGRAPGESHRRERACVPAQRSVAEKPGQIAQA